MVSASKDIRIRRTAFLAVLLMAAAAFGVVAIAESDNSDAATMYTVRQGSTAPPYYYFSDAMDVEDVTINSVTYSNEVGLSYTPTYSEDDGYGIIVAVPESCPLDTYAIKINYDFIPNGDEPQSSFETFYIKVIAVQNLSVSDQSVVAGGSVSIDTGISGVTVSGQDWLHVSSDGRIYGTAPSAPGTYTATAGYGSQSVSFTITVVSTLVFTSNPAAGVIAYEG